MKVLLADDDPLSRKFIENLLQASNHAVESHEDGQQAYEAILREDSPQVILLDWVMPELDGLEICEKLTRETHRREKYILILSSIQDRNEIAQILSAGADDYMTKPIHEYEFMARLQVAERMVDSLNGLKKRNLELENVVRRYTQMAELQSKRQAEPPEQDARPVPEEVSAPPKQLPETAKKSGSRQTPTAPDATGPDKTDEKSSTHKELPSGVSKLQATKLLPHIVANTFSSFQMESQSVEAAQQHANGVYIAWATLYFLKAETWCDLQLEYSHDTAEALATKLLEARSEYPEQDHVDTGAQLVNFLLEDYRRIMNKELMASQVTYTPGACWLENKRYLQEMSMQARSYGFEVDGHPFNLWLSATPSPIIQKPIDLISPFTVIAEPLRSLNQSSMSVMKKWSVLNEESIKTLQEMADTKKISHNISVIQPSPVYIYLYEQMSACWQ